jgi:hypothetical protein
MTDQNLTSQDLEGRYVSPALVFVGLVAALNLSSALASLALAG